MDREPLKDAFDRQASSCDPKWSRRDAAVLPARDIEAIIVSGGFEPPVRFFQAGLIHAWYSRRMPELGATPSTP